MTRVVALAVTLVLGWPLGAVALDPPPGSPLALRQHPRLVLHASTLPEIRTRLATRNRAGYQTWLAMQEANFRSTAAADPSTTRGYWSDDMTAWAALAVIGAVPGVVQTVPPAEFRARALALARAGIAARKGAEHVVLAYDWLWADLTPEQRAAAVAYFATFDSGNSGNPYNEADYSEMMGYVLAGLACWGDGIDDAMCDSRASAYLVRYAAEGTGHSDAATWMAGGVGGWGEGLSYSLNTRHQLKAFVPMEAWRTAMGLSHAAVYGEPRVEGLALLAPWYAYHVYPHAVPDAQAPDGYRWTLYKTHHMEAGLSAGLLHKNLLLVAGQLAPYWPEHASLARWLLMHRAGHPVWNGSTAREYGLWWCLWDDPTVPERSTSTLPTSILFPKLGWRVVRGWGLTDSMVTFTAAKWSRAAGTYTNSDQGTWTIARRGPLIIQSGPRIHHDYSNSTWSGNVLLFVDPNETPPCDKPCWDRGGQRRVTTVLRDYRQYVDGSTWDLGGVDRVAEGQGWYYVSADITRAYNSTLFNESRNPSKVSSVRRQQVYLPGPTDRVVLYDRIVLTDPRWHPRFLIHPSRPPTIDATPTVVREGEWRYAGARTFRVRNDQQGSFGRLVGHVLAPAAVDLIVIGGPGHEFEDPYGVNMPETYSADKVQYVGTHRVEVRPAQPALTHRFLVAVEAMDADHDQELTPTVPTATGAYAVTFGDVTLVFGQDETPLMTATVTLAEAGRILVCDLEPAMRYTFGGQLVTASMAGTAVVTVPTAGTVTLAREAMTPRPPFGVTLR